MGWGDHSGTEGSIATIRALLPGRPMGSVGVQGVHESSLVHCCLLFSMMTGDLAPTLPLFAVSRTLGANSQASTHQNVVKQLEDQPGSPAHMETPTIAEQRPIGLD